MADEKPSPPDKEPDKKTDQPRAFSIPTPLPDDSGSIHARPIDDDAVDFGQMPASASGSAVLSHSQISGPLSGTSVVAWTDLMKARAEEDSKLQYDSLENIDLDSDSDEDLLAKALASEPPSGKLNIPKDDRPHGALSKEFIDLDAEADSRNRRFSKDPEAVLPNFAGDESSSILADSHLPDSNGNSHINLMARNEKNTTGDSLTDEVEIGQVPPDSGESSAVDLGSESFIELPFPSTGSGTGSGPRSKTGRSSARRRREDSSTVDLMTGTGGQGLSSVPGITAIGSGLRPDSGLPTTRRVEVFGARTNGWLGGGLIGGLTGVAVCVGIWLSGALSPKPQPVNNSPAAQTPAVDPVLTALKQALQVAKLNPDDPVAAFTKLANDKTTADSAVKQAQEIKQTLEANQKSLQAQLSAAESAAQKSAEEKKSVDTALQAARNELTAKETERQRLDDELKKAKTLPQPAKPAPMPTDNADLNKLKEQIDMLQARSGELERDLAIANRSIETLKQTIRDLAGFVLAVRQRLQSPPDAKPNEILVNLDAKLAAKPAPELGSPLPGSASTDARADRAFHRGLVYYRQGDWAGAEREFLTGIGLHNRDARIWYFLGLTQAKLGQAAKADESFRQALEREQRNLPSPDSIDALLERMPPEARSRLNQVRGRG